MFFDIIQNLKFMEPNKYIYQNHYENIYLNVSYDFKKLDGYKKSCRSKHKW
jgi:hypothetical protein